MQYQPSQFLKNITLKKGKLNFETILQSKNIHEKFQGILIEST